MLQENNKTLMRTSLAVTIILLLTCNAISLLGGLPYGQQIKAQSYLPVSSFDSTIDNSSAVADDMNNDSQLFDGIVDSGNESFITYSPTQMEEEDTLDLVFVSVIPYTGD